MPGLLSSIFDGSPIGDEEEGQPSDMKVADDEDADADHQGSSSNHAVDGYSDVHLDPSITISSTMSGSYEAPDGSTHSWERTDEVTLTTDTQLTTEIKTILGVDETMA